MENDTQTTHPLEVSPARLSATAAALDGSAFSSINANESVPATWEERARKAWDYYVEEPPESLSVRLPGQMMVMIREIKQAARQILSWIFDDWQQL